MNKSAVSIDSRLMQMLAFAACTVILFHVPSNILCQEFWARGGVSLSGSSLVSENDNSYLAFAGITPFVGLTLEKQVESAFSIETGLVFTSKKYSEKTSIFENNRVYGIAFESHGYFVEVPLWLKPRCTLNEQWDLFGIFGGYIGIGFGGSFIFEMSTSSGEYRREQGSIYWNWSGTSDNQFGVRRRYEIGHTLGVGLESKNVQFLLHFSRSMTGIHAIRLRQQSLLTLSLGVKLSAL